MSLLSFYLTKLRRYKLSLYAISISYVPQLSFNNDLIRTHDLKLWTTNSLKNNLSKEYLGVVNYHCFGFAHTRRTGMSPWGFTLMGNVSSSIVLK
jgi:hypothetical protein